MLSPEPQNLHLLSHRGLTHDLIPLWLESRVHDLDGRIESSAYGETPEELLPQLIQRLQLGPQDTFLDLGAGAGNLLAAVSKICRRSFGIERNPALVRAGREQLEYLGLPSHDLMEGDFIEQSWPEVTKVYAATARFSAGTLTRLAALLHKQSSIQRVASLGRSLPMLDDWKLEHRTSLSVRWNHDENAIEESLELWSRAAILPS